MARDCGFCFYVRKCGLMIWLRSSYNIMKPMSKMSEGIIRGLQKVLSVKNILEGNILI